MNTSLQRFLQFPVIKIVAGNIFCLGALVVIKKYIAQPLLYRLFDTKTVADTIKNCISFSVLLIAYSLFSRYYEQRKPVELASKNLAREIPGGLALGFFTISLVVLVLYLAGYYHISGISVAGYSLQLFTLLLTAALVEDLLNRGLMVRILENWLGTYITLVIAMLFELLHVFNPNSTLFSTIMDLAWGAAMTLLYVYSKRIWLPFFFHVGWNFAQPFYGSNLTGLDDMGTIIQSKIEGPVWLTGGKVGVEGSIFTIVFLLIIAVVFFRWSKREGKIIDRISFNRSVN